jgi:hypothetical protein
VACGAGAEDADVGGVDAVTTGAEEAAGPGLGLGQDPIVAPTMPTRDPHFPTGAGLVVIVILIEINGVELVPGFGAALGLMPALLPATHVPAKPVGAADPEHTSPEASVHTPAQPVSGLLDPTNVAAGGLGHCQSAAVGVHIAEEEGETTGETAPAPLPPNPQPMMGPTIKMLSNNDIPTWRIAWFLIINVSCFLSAGGYGECTVTG